MRYYGGGNSSTVDKTYIPCNPTDAINVGQADFTIEFFMRADTALQNGSATAGANYSWINSPIIVDRDLIGDVGSGGDFGVSMTDGRITFGVENSAASQRTIIGTTDLRDDFRHHVAVTRDRSTGDLAVYVDGAREALFSGGPSGDVHVASDAESSTYNKFICIGGEKHALDWKKRIKQAIFIITGAYLTVLAAMIPLWFAGAGLLKGFAFTTIAGLSFGVLIARPAYAAIIEKLLQE